MADPEEKNDLLKNVCVAFYSGLTEKQNSTGMLVYPRQYIDISRIRQ